MNRGAHRAIARRTMLTASVLAMVLPSLLLSATAASEPPSCVVVDSTGRYLVAAVDPGRPGGPRAAHRADPSTQRRPRPTAVDAPTAPQLPPVAGMPLGNGGWAVGQEPDPEDVVDPFSGARRTSGGAATTPVVLARRAVKLLTLEPPVLHTSVQDAAFVGVPLWLWIEDSSAFTGPVSATATAGAASVTAVGRLTTVEWTMGPAGATVRCLGPGTPWTGQDGPHPTAVTSTNSAHFRSAPTAPVAGRSPRPACGR
jgi:hypothetical protein